MYLDTLHLNSNVIYLGDLGEYRLCIELKVFWGCGEHGVLHRSVICLYKTNRQVVTDNSYSYRPINNYKISKYI